MPVEDRSRLTSPFGKRSLDYLSSKEHWGQDFGGPTPGQSVKALAACDGVVEFTHGSVKYRTGPILKIRTPDGGAITYGHVRNVRVKAGDKVRRGDWIAETWHTGIPLAWGIHLHFERWTDTHNHASVIDPIPFLEQYGWEVEDGRLYDRWEGRPTKTPAPTITVQAATTTTTKTTTAPAKVGELSMSDVQKILDKIAELEAKIDATTNDKQGVELRETTAWRIKEGKQQATTASRVLQEIHGAAFESARAAGVSETILNGIVNRTTEQEA